MKIGDVIPKLPSTASLFQTLLVLPMDGYAPLSVAFPVPQAAVAGHTGGRGCPTVTVVASPVYTLRVTTIFPEVKPGNDCAEASETRAPRVARPTAYRERVSFVNMYGRSIKRGIELT